MMAASSNVFPVSASFVTSCYDLYKLPENLDRPEIAFVGRSNSGKSTLINALVAKSLLARTSKQPGRTQALNFFDVSLRKKVRAEGAAENAVETIETYFVDLPGYGYARVPESELKRWREQLMAYLIEREQLEILVLIMDVRRDVAEEERTFLKLNGRNFKNLLLVLTKSDKLTKNELAKRLAAIKSSASINSEDIFVTAISPAVKSGIEKVREKIFSVLKAK